MKGEEVSELVIEKLIGQGRFRNTFVEQQIRSGYRYFHLPENKKEYILVIIHRKLPTINILSKSLQENLNTFLES